MADMLANVCNFGKRPSESLELDKISFFNSLSLKDFSKQEPAHTLNKKSRTSDLDRFEVTRSKIRLPILERVVIEQESREKENSFFALPKLKNTKTRKDSELSIGVDKIPESRESFLSNGLKMSSKKNINGNLIKILKVQIFNYFSYVKISSSKF